MEDKDFNEFKEFNRSLNKLFEGLFNLEKKEKYLIGILGVTYSILSYGLFKVKRNIIKVPHMDVRFHLILCIMSGNGKSEFKKVMRKIIGDDDFIEATSLHQEQLVGTVLDDGTLVFGYLSRGLFFQNDALKWLKDPNYDEARR